MSQESELNFSATNKSALGSALSGFSYSLPSSWAFDLNNSASYSVLGIGISGSADVHGGLTGTISATTGKFDISYPVSVNATFANTVTDGQIVTIDTSNYSIQGAALSLVGPGIGASLDFSLGGSLSLTATGWAGITVSLGVDIPLSLQQQYSSAYGSITIAAPTSFVANSGAPLNATGTLPELSANGQTTDFLSASLNLANLAAALAAWPPLSGSVSLVGQEFSYNILAANLVGGLALGQDVTFNPTGVSVTMTYGGQIETKPLGESFTFTAPSSGSGIMDISVTYTLEGTIQTQTGIVGNLAVNLSALEADGLGIHLGPLVSVQIPDPSWSTGLQSWNSVIDSFAYNLSTTDDYIIAYSPLNIVRTYSQFLGDTTPYLSEEFVTVADSSSVFQALSASEIAQLATNNVDVIDATDNKLQLTVDRYYALGSVSLTAVDNVILGDRHDFIEALTPAQIVALAENGIDRIDATDNVLSLTVAQYLASSLTGTMLTAADTVTLADTSANIETLTSHQFATLAANGIDVIDATDNILSLTVAQYMGYLFGAPVTLTAADTVTLAAPGAHIAALTAAQIAALASNGIDIIDATDNVLSLTVAQYQALIGTGVTLTQADTVTLSDTATHIAALTPQQIAELADNGIDNIDTSNSASTTGGLLVDFQDLVPQNTLLFLSPNYYYDSIPNGYDGFVWSAGQAPLGFANVENLSIPSGYLVASQSLHVTTVAFEPFASQPVDIHREDNGTFTFNSVYLTSAWDAVQQVTLTGFDSQGAVVGTSTVEVNNLAPTFVQENWGLISDLKISNSSTANSHLVLNNFSFFDNEPSLTIAQYLALGGVTLTHTVTLADTGANIFALAPTQIAALADNGIDIIDATDNALTLSVNQYQALGTVKLTAADTVTLADTGQVGSGHLSALTHAEFAALAGNGIDAIDATDNVLTLDVLQYLLTSPGGFGSIGLVTLTQADTVTLADTGANIATLTGVQFGVLGSNGIDIIDSTTNSLSLSLLQYNTLGPVLLTIADTVTVTLVKPEFGGLSAQDFNNIGMAHVDIIDVDGSGTNSTVSIDEARAAALVVTGGLSIAAGDIVTLADAGRSIELLTAVQMAKLAVYGVDRIDATDNMLSLTVAQYIAHNRFAPLTLTATDTVTLTDTGANIASLTGVQFGALAGNGIDIIDATDNVLSLSFAQAEALGPVTIAAPDSVTLFDTEANIEAMTVAQINALAGHGIDFADASNSTTLGLTQAQQSAFAAVGITFPHDTLGNVIIGTVAADKVDATHVPSGQMPPSNGADFIFGLGGNDVISSLGGNDFIDGGTGADSMAGGAGNDTYVIDNVGDKIIELAGGGTDSVQSSVTYTLAANVENLMLTGGTSINGTGNALANAIQGNDGDNILAGLGGADAIDGGLGNNTLNYAASTAGVAVSLQAHTASGGDATGDTFVNIQNLIGSGKNDILEGDGNNNTLNGGAGIDTISYANASAGVTVNLATTSAQNTVGAGTDTLSAFENVTGSNFADNLTGTTGANVFAGGTGDDVMTSGGGKGDVFLFDGATPGNDTIMGYTMKNDKLSFDHTFFADANAVLNAAHTVGTDVVITENGSNSITLHNMLIANLHTTDILFH